jgi:catalase (peroxidase I)
LDLGKVRKSIVEVVENEAEQHGDGTSLAGTFVPLAWHSCNTYQALDASGGSNGACQRFHPETSYGNNAGLNVAQDALEPVKSKFPALTELYTYAGVVAIEEAGRPKIKFEVDEKT